MIEALGASYCPGCISSLGEPHYHQCWVYWPDE
jgi:hypothetical protein